jgi:hypothetical protein
MQNSFGSKAWSKKEIMECSYRPGIAACAAILLMEALKGWLANKNPAS